MYWNPKISTLLSVHYVVHQLYAIHHRAVEMSIYTTLLIATDSNVVCLSTRDEGERDRMLMLVEITVGERNQGSSKGWLADVP